MTEKGKYGIINPRPMAKELVYVLINPYTILKSRTGGVINRLLSWGRLSLVGARMFAPSRQLVEEYVRVMNPETRGEKEKKIVEEIKRYILTHYLPRKGKNSRPRVMLLLLEGENGIETLRRVVGHITRVSIGETIRGTYGDYIEDVEGNIKYFEPAVLIGTDKKSVERELKVWAKYSEKDGGLLEGVIKYPPGIKPERTLVLIKPDSFQELSSRAGNIIDRFSQTGLFIVGAKVIKLSLAQAAKFYAPIKPRLAEKLKIQLEKDIQSALEKKFGFSLTPQLLKELSERLKHLKAEQEFNKILHFITGKNPQEVPREEWEKPGEEKCLALVYEGREAIGRIRRVLGETNPEEATPGTVRKDFGHDVIRNGAHASDSPQAAEREIQIVGIGEDDIKEIVEKYYGKIT